jgi:glycosyltransferase involved in cell wall biosynthesis
MEKILFLYPYGGFVLNRSAFIMGQGILNELIKRNYEIYVIPRSEEETEFAKYKNLKILDFHAEIKIISILEKNTYVNLNHKYFQNISRQVRQLKIDVILERHSLFNKGYLISKYTGIPYVTNDVVVYPDLKYYGNQLQRWLLKAFPYAFEKYVFNIEKKSLLSADAIISHSVAYTDILVKNYGIDKNIIFQFYAMVDKERFTVNPSGKTKAQLGLPDNKFIVTYVGSFDKLHNPDNIIPVINQLKCENLFFVLVGDGELLYHVKNQISNPNVIFTGRIKSEEVINYLQCSDLCLETIWNERVLKYGADSIKIYEYLACGKPVIASKLPGQIMELQENQAGFLVNPNVPEQVISKIKLLFEDRNLAVEMGINGRRLIDERWNWDYTGDIISKALKFAIQNKQSN